MQQTHMRQIDDRQQNSETIKLLAAIAAEKQLFVKAAELFYQTPSNAAYIKTLAQLIIDGINRIKNAGDWNSSPYLQSQFTLLAEIHEKAENILNQQHNEKNLPVNPLQEDTNHQLIYVSLYQNVGHDLSRWESQLNNIEKYLIGRPIYQTEEGVVQAIRRKTSQASEAYVVILVNKRFILQNDFLAKKIDANGNALIHLLPGAVSNKQISEFVHLNQRYQLLEGKLILKTFDSKTRWDN